MQLFQMQSLLRRQVYCFLFVSAMRTPTVHTTVAVRPINSRVRNKVALLLSFCILEIALARGIYLHPGNDRSPVRDRIAKMPGTSKTKARSRRSVMQVFTLRIDGFAQRQLLDSSEVKVDVRTRSAAHLDVLDANTLRTPPIVAIDQPDRNQD